MKQENKSAPHTDEHGAHPCEGCLHFYGCFNVTRCCNYIFDMGTRRPCKPGAECTVKRLIETKEDLKLRKAKGFLL